MPLQCAGALREVYPGFVRAVTAFVLINLERHLKSHLDLFAHLAGGEHEKTGATKAFYDEYFRGD